MSPLLIKISKDLKLLRCPRSLAPTLVTLPSMSLNPQLHSRRHWDSYALAQSGRRTHPVPLRAQNAFWGTGFQSRIARGGARPGRVSAGSAFHRGTGRDDGGDRADG